MSGTTRASRYQKGNTRKVKTNLDSLEQEIVSGSGICNYCMSLSCTISEILLFPKIYRGYVTETTPIWGLLAIRRLIIVYTANQCTQLEVSSLSHSRNILRGLKIKYGSLDVTAPLSGTVCHPWAGTCYYKPARKIWSLYVHPLPRYERQRKMQKLGCMVWELGIT